MSTRKPVRYKRQRHAGQGFLELWPVKRPSSFGVCGADHPQERACENPAAKAVARGCERLAPFEDSLLEDTLDVYVETVVDSGSVYRVHELGLLWSPATPTVICDQKPYELVCLLEFGVETAFRQQVAELSRSCLPVLLTDGD